MLVLFNKPFNMLGQFTDKTTENLPFDYKIIRYTVSKKLGQTNRCFPELYTNTVERLKNDFTF